QSSTTHTRLLSKIRRFFFEQRGRVLARLVEQASRLSSAVGVVGQASHLSEQIPSPPNHLSPAAGSEDSAVPAALSPPITAAIEELFDVSNETQKLSAFLK